MCRRLSSYAALCALSMLSACEKSATGPVQVTVSIVPSEVDIEVGGQAELQAIVTASGGAADPHPVDWRSSDTNIAQVSATGLVTGIGPGPVACPDAYPSGSGHSGWD